jgi:hypothetical protein
MKADLVMEIAISFCRCLFNTSRMARENPHKKNNVVIRIKGTR